MQKGSPKPYFSNLMLSVLFKTRQAGDYEWNCVHYSLRIGRPTRTKLANEKAEYTHCHDREIFEALRFVGGSTGPRQKVPRHLGDCRLIFQVLIEVNCAGRKDEG